MNRYKWWKLTRAVRKHPYLVDDNFVMSDKRAKSIWQEAGGYPSFADTISNMKRIYDFPAETWALTDQACENSRKREQRQAPNARKRRNRLIAIAAAVVLMFSFMALTPPGRAIAKAFIEWVTSISNGYTVVENADAEYHIVAGSAPAETFFGDELTNTEEPDIVAYSSIEQFVNDTHLVPVIIDDDGLLLKEVLCKRIDEKTSVLITVYLDADSNEITITQRWNIGEGVVRDEIENYVFETIVFGKHTMRFYMDKTDKTISGKAVLQDSLLTLNGKFGLDFEMIVKKLSYY